MNLSKNPWSWVPSLYFAEGIPYVAVMTIALVLYKQLGLSNTEITYYTSWLYLPWVIKPLWSPFIDLIKTKRWWITSMQILIGAAFGGVAFTIPTDFWLQGTLAFFWLMAFSSATHDIAADGYYMLALDSHEQSWFVGIRSTFYRLAMIVGQGVLVMIAGTLEIIFRNQIAYSWSLLFYGCCGLFIAIWIWHTYVLPHPSEDGVREGVSASTILADFKETIKTFFQKEQVLVGILFIARRSSCKDFYPFPHRCRNQWWFGPFSSGVRVCSGNNRCHRINPWWYSWWYCGRQGWFEEMVVAYGLRHNSS